MPTKAILRRNDQSSRLRIGMKLWVTVSLGFKLFLTSCRTLYLYGPYARKNKTAPAGNECYNVFFFDAFYIWFLCISFFGVELGDWFEVVLGPGVMDRPGSEAVGIGAEADVKHSELFASAERWKPTLEACRAALRVATITQGTCSSIHIAAASSQVFTLLLLKPRYSIQG